MMSDSYHTVSGFATASRNLATQLAGLGYDVNYIGWQTFGQDWLAANREKLLGFKALPNVGGNKFGETAWKFWMNQINPDLFFILSDFWMSIDNFRHEKPCPYMMWYPIDGAPITTQIVDMIKRIDYPVCMSEFGTNLVREAGVATKTIYHGVDTDIYKPQHPKVIEEWKHKIGIPRNAFVVGRIDRNQTRKKIPLTLEAFVKLKKDYPDSVLVLWMDRRDPEGWDLEFVIKRMGLQEGKDVIFPPATLMANFMYGTDPTDLTMVMNTFDVHCWLTGGEGFGLTGAETMACGVVNVATDYTTPKEIFGNWTCGLPVKVKYFECGQAGVDRAFADPDHAYEQMKWLRENPDERKAMGEAGVRRAREVYPWNKIGKQFDELIRGIL